MSENETTDDRPTIFELMPMIMGELPAIGKEHQMGDGRFGYKYRSIEDITAPLQRLCAKHGVFVLPTVLKHEANDIVVEGKHRHTVDMTIKWTFYGPRGDQVTAVTHGEARDSGDKGTQKAATSAFKYLLMPAFMIADPDDDLDNAQEQAPRQQQRQAPAKKAPAKPTTPKPILQEKAEHIVEREGPALALVMDQSGVELAELMKKVPQADRQKVRDLLEERVGKNLLSTQLTDAQFRKAKAIIAGAIKTDEASAEEVEETGELCTTETAQRIMIKGKTDLGLGSDQEVRQWCALEFGVSPGSLTSLKQLTANEATRCLQKMEWQFEAKNG